MDLSAKVIFESQRPSEFITNEKVVLVVYNNTI